MVYNLQQGLRVGELFRNGFHDSDIMSLLVDKHGKGGLSSGEGGRGGCLKGAGTRGGKGRAKYFRFETSS
jgi:hypothetical protein